jgi:hypothetical protein
MEPHADENSVLSGISKHLPLSELSAMLLESMTVETMGVVVAGTSLLQVSTTTS